jgi:protein SCO1
MDKMGAVVDRLGKLPRVCKTQMHRPNSATDQTYGNPILHPVFITVDPARDSPAQIARYVADFHPRFTGLSGDYAATKATCKSYRVYFSTPKDAKVCRES